MPQDLHHIQEQTFQVLKEVLDLLQRQEKRLDRLQRQVEALQENTTHQ